MRNEKIFQAIKKRYHCDSELAIMLYDLMEDNNWKVSQLDDYLASEEFETYLNSMESIYN